MGLAHNEIHNFLNAIIDVWPPVVCMCLCVCVHAGIKLIKDLANEVDELTSLVVEKAEQVGRSPGDKHAKEQLDALRRKWAGKVQKLTQVIDDIIDPEDFMMQSGDYLWVWPVMSC